MTEMTLRHDHATMDSRMAGPRDPKTSHSTLFRPYFLEFSSAEIVAFALIAVYLSRVCDLSSLVVLNLAGVVLIVMLLLHVSHYVYVDVCTNTHRWG